MGHYSTEISAKSEDLLIGVRGLYNVHWMDDKDLQHAIEKRPDPEEAFGKWSVGGEVYYTAKERSGGG